MIEDGSVKCIKALDQISAIRPNFLSLALPANRIAWRLARHRFGYRPNIIRINIFPFCDLERRKINDPGAESGEIRGEM